MGPSNMWALFCICGPTLYVEVCFLLGVSLTGPCINVMRLYTILLGVEIFFEPDEESDIRSE